MNLHDLTDEELADHLNSVLAEQERRAAIANIPAQMREMSAKYQAGGGQLDALRDAIETPPSEPPATTTPEH